MNPLTRSIRKTIDLSAVSTFTLEDQVFVDALLADGRANVHSRRNKQPGGLNVYAVYGVRLFDPAAGLALLGLIGGRDADEARVAVKPLGAETSGLWPVGGKFTNRSEVILGPETRLILRHSRDIDWQTDLDWPACRRMLGKIGRSSACLIGNLSVDFTRTAIDFGRKVGTFISLVAGERQFGELRGLEPDLLVMNCSEAWIATGSNTTDPDEVFDRLVGFSPAEVVVMTNGASLAHVANQKTGKQFRIGPPRLNGRLYTLGAGDVFAGAVSFLFSQARGAVSDDVLVKAVAFAHEVAAAHITGDPSRQECIRARYRDEVSRLYESGAEPLEPPGNSKLNERRAA